MNLPKLSPRLKQIAELVPPCETFADIGTDHAYLPVYLINKGICKLAIASDLREGPLSRAEETARLFGAEDRVSLRLGSGFETLKDGEVSVAAVAGMGGVLTAELLKSSEKTVKALKTLILQPMTAVYELRVFLYENGYKVEEEYLVKEEDKLYHILKVLPNAEENEKTEIDLFFGDRIKKDSPYYNEYKKRQIKKLECRISGMKKSKDCGNLAKEIEKSEHLLALVKKY